MKKIEKIKHFVITAEMFKQDVLVCFNKTPKEAFQIYKKLNKNFTEEDSKFICEDKEHGEVSTIGTMYPMSLGYIVLLKWYKNSFRKNICCAVHELTHVSHYILRNVRIPLNVDTEESYTYLLEELTGKFLHKLY